VQWIKATQRRAYRIALPLSLGANRRLAFPNAPSVWRKPQFERTPFIKLR
jgi:hypothetical protein